MSNSYRYVYFCPTNAFGGLEMQMVQLAAQTIRMKKSALIVTSPGSPIEEYACQLNVPVKTIKLLIDYVDFLASRALGRIFKDFKANICIVGITRHLSIALAARQLKTPNLSVVLFQQMISGLDKHDFFHDWVYNNLDSAIVPAAYMKEMLAESTIMQRDKIHINPYGIDIDSFDAKKFNRNDIRKKFGLPADKLIIGMPARFDQLKDQETAVKAFAKANLSNSLLVLAGAGDDNYKNYIMQIVQDYEIEDKVKFIPFTYSFPALINSFDIYLLPSLIETFSLALLQAMASGKAIIATNCGGTPEAIRHKHNGLLFEPKDYDKLAAYMKLLIDNDKLRFTLGSQAAIDAVNKYDGKRQLSKFFNICENSYRKRNQLNIESLKEIPLIEKVSLESVPTH